MHFLKILNIVLLLLFFNMQLVMAQEEYIVEQENYYEDEEWIPNGGWMISFDFNWSNPLFQTYEQLKKPVFGFSTNLLYQPIKHIALFSGLAFSFGQYDSESLEYYDFDVFEEYLFEESTSCRLISMDFKIRYFPGFQFWRFEPFIDLSIGSRYSFAFTQVQNTELGESTYSKFEKGDWSMGYSIGGGTLINPNLDDTPIYFHLGINYAGGMNSFMYIFNEDETTGFEDPIDRFERKSIPIQYLKVDLGVIFYF